ncbi:uncharacterized protein EV422DRAFT_522110 [Fimicolochytrium jonesii]|uniref:uncharacterized protein n=1 Tax=Fimicolochytrium jonesii TaxID=1396493 RepID=UPI0022FF37B1|nr:uncharacterized protein EV422DRAFT_522110 [Fimicolochytrium jonesii]KAI8823728.1 hypothetical protein EV422DRAFT_522110 [Fimicolochytrium jonesii]
MATVNITACIANPTVQKFFTDLGTPIAQEAAVKAALAYGLPGVFVGCIWPLGLAALIISTWRLFTHASIRAWLLFIAALLVIGDCTVQSWAKATSPILLTSQTPERMKYIELSISIGMIRSTVLFSAASWRFAIVYPTRSARRMIIWGMSLLAVAMFVISMGVGISDVHKMWRASKLYWGLAAVLPGSYAIIGTVTFTRTIRNTSNALKGAQGAHQGLTQLQLSNNVLMVATILDVIALILVSQLLDSTKNPYVLPVSIGLSGFWTFLENAFEVVTIGQKVVSAASPVHSVQASGTGATGGRPKKEAMPGRGYSPTNPMLEV